MSENTMPPERPPHGPTRASTPPTAARPGMASAKWLRSLATIGLLIAFMDAGTLWWTRAGANHKAGAGSTNPGIQDKSIAVIPFVIIGAGKTN